MKQLIIIMLLVSTLFSIQDKNEEWSVDQIPKTVNYCKIQAFGTSLSVEIYLDFGQPAGRYIVLKKGNLKVDGSIATFTGIIAALNYMYKNGWELFSVYDVNGVYHYILSRKK
jgi:hypothetical protein